MPYLVSSVHSLIDLDPSNRPPRAKFPDSVLGQWKFGLFVAPRRNRHFDPEILFAGKSSRRLSPPALFGYCGIVQSYAIAAAQEHF